MMHLLKTWLVTLFIIFIGLFALVSALSGIVQRSPSAIAYSVNGGDTATTLAPSPTSTRTATYTTSSGSLPPTLTAISPTQAYNFQATTIIITGTDFVATPILTLDNTPLLDVTFINSTTLTATVPADLPGGVYTLTVTNPDGQNANLPNAFTVMLGGSGTVNSWQYVSPMSVARMALAAVRAGNNIYALGGVNTDVTLNSVEHAVINNDGTLGPWQPATPMNVGRGKLAAVRVDNYIYALGGSSDNGSSVLDSVERAAINNDGSLGPWQYMNSMTTRRYFLTAVATNGYIYALGGAQLDAIALSTVERAAINADGTLGVWQLMASMTTPRQGPASVAVNGYIYALGGISNTAVEDSVERAAINADGTLDSWQVVSPMTTVRCGFAAVVVGGYLFALAGDTNTEVLNSVERAAINTDGTLDSWQLSATTMLQGRWLPSVVTINNYIYVIGGNDNVFDLNTVERGTVNAPSLDSVTPSLIPSDRPSEVTITGTNFLPSPVLHLNDLPPLDVSFVSSSTLTATIPMGLATGWYTATLTNLDGQVVSRVNALQVDGAGPAGSLDINGGALSTTSISVTLTLSATDPTNPPSELSMSLSNDGTTWSDWQPYTSSTTWPLSLGDGEKTVYGLFRDPADNISSVVTDTIELDTSVGTEYGLTINDGSLFTSQVTVTLTIAARPNTAQIMVSNDGGFAGAVWEPYVVHRQWEITSYGNYTIPRIVYTRYKDVNGNVSATYQDDIILDVTAPGGGVFIGSPSDIGAVPTNITVTLILSATDDVSGVDAMMLSNHPDFAGATWEPYATTRNWSLENNNTVYVRFRDNAGNISVTYSASLLAPCSLAFTDVPPDSTFYPYVRCLACRNVLGGYSDGTFRPANDVTRGQLSKIVANAAGFDSQPTGQSFEDVPPTNTFYLFIERMAALGIIGGYPCGGPGEPCGPGNLPYFRPGSNATRGQISKIDANAAGYDDTPVGQQFEDVAPGSTYYTYTYRLVTRSIMSGYPCGGAGEPCGPSNLPYFRPNNNATRGQTAKIVSNTFFPYCQTPTRP